MFGLCLAELSPLGNHSKMVTIFLHRMGLFKDSGIKECEHFCAVRGVSEQIHSEGCKHGALMLQ